MAINVQLKTILKLLALLLVFACLAMLFLPWLNAKVALSAYGFSEEYSSSSDVFSTGSTNFGEEELDVGYTSFWSVMLIILAALAFLTVLAAVYGISRERSVFVLPLACLAVLLFLFDIFQGLHMKSVLNGIIDNYSYLKDMFNISAGPGVGVWLFLFFGLGAYGLMFVLDRMEGRSSFDFSGLSMPKVNVAGAGAWTCPACGARQGASKAFCDNCGSKKPEPPRCPACGKVLKIGERFCDSCGARVN